MITENSIKAADESAKQQAEENAEIQEMKKAVNEIEVNAKLHIQYMERQIEGTQLCQDRMYAKEESQMEAQIKYLESQLETEKQVTDTIRSHLKDNENKLREIARERDRQRESELAELELKRENIRNEKTAAEEEYEEIKRFIAEDNEWRETVARLEKEKQDADDEKVKEKADMDEATRFI